jgi:outer membrane usher protein
MEPMVLDIILNSQDKGEFFVNRTVDNDYLVKVEDLESMGINKAVGKITKIDDKQYISLKSIVKTKYVLNEKTLTLEITADPALFPKKIIDFRSGQVEKIYYPKDSSIFLNYGINYYAGESFRFNSLNLANELGARWQDYLFLTNSTYTKSDTGSKFTRLMSSITRDDRTTLRRYVAGDFLASSGELGGGVNMGGLSFSKIYRIDPYFINYPTVDFSGNVSLPSEAEIYLNGVRIRTEKLAPGTFQLRNLTAYSGAGTLEVVIKDQFGRIRRFVNPFYFTNTLLKKGLHEYSYNIGLTRQDYGTSSNQYSTLAFSAFHRYGLSDSLTLGFTAEAKKGLYNGGAETSFVLSPAGIFSMAVSGSTGNDDSGLAGSFNYTYQGRMFSGRLLVRGFTRNYGNLANSLLTEKPKYELGAYLGFSTQNLGSLSLDFLKTEQYEGDNRQVASVTYSRNLTWNSNISATYRRVEDQGSSDEFLVSLNYYPWRETSLSTRYEKNKDGSTQDIQIQKNTPAGEGLGYRATLERKENGGDETYTVNPYVQYNGRYGTYSVEFRKDSGNNGAGESYNLSAAGSLAYLGSTFGLLRPVTDSFGIVKVGDLKGVRVYQNSQEIGRTDSSGKVFVPDLGSYYDNQVSINDKDIPMDYSLAAVRKFVSPPLRSGSCISFGVTKVQPVTGKLKIRMNGVVKPLEFYEITMMLGSRRIKFPTGKDGEFYLDINQPDGTIAPAPSVEAGCSAFNEVSGTELKAGKYHAFVDFIGKKLPFEMVIPPSKDFYIDLGDLVIEPSSPTEKSNRGNQP